MENSKYSSLTQKLIQNGILSEDEKEIQVSNIDSFYGIELDEDMSNSPFIEKPIEAREPEIKNKKRINQYDLELLNNDDENFKSNNAFKIIRRFLNLKQNQANKLERLLFALFPNLYKVKLAKDAMKRLEELNIDTKKLLEKTIPYGEGEIRYQNLVKYINYANEIQVKLKKQI